VAIAPGVGRRATARSPTLTSWKTSGAARCRRRTVLGYCGRIRSGLPRAEPPGPLVGAPAPIPPRRRNCWPGDAYPTPLVSLRRFCFVSFRRLIVSDESRTVEVVSESVSPAGGSGNDGCHFPGCTRASRPDPVTGRPSLYCEQPDPDGGPVHNRASAWKARRVQRAGVVVQEDAVAAPVSLARATLEQQLAELPAKVGELREVLDDVMAGIRAAGDVEAAGAEVEDAHREALTKVTEAERRASAAERAARLAEERAVVAEREREEADALAEEAIAETARVREELQAEIAQVRADADVAVARAREELAATEAEHRSRMDERDAEVERARQDANAAQLDAASARAAQQAADDAATRERETAAQLRRQVDQARREFDEARQRLQAELDTARQSRQQAADETAAARLELATLQADSAATQRAAQADREALAALRREFEQHRADARSEREAVRAAHTEQLAQVQRNADERATALNEALSLARETAETYRTQVAEARTPSSPQGEQRTTRKRPQ